MQQCERDREDDNGMDFLPEGIGIYGHNSSSKEDKVVQTYLEKEVPFLPSVKVDNARFNGNINFEHAFTSLKELANDSTDSNDLHSRII